MHGFFSQEESVIGEGPSMAAVWAMPMCKRAAQGSADEWYQSTHCSCGGYYLIDCQEGNNWISSR